MNITEATQAWNQAKTEAEADLTTLEATLKSQFNAYVDALTAYLERLDTANNVFGSIHRSMPEQGDQNKFSMLGGVITNKAVEYMIDDYDPSQPKSPMLVRACDFKTLRERKAQ